MRTLQRMFMLAAAAGLAVGCGDDGGDPVNITPPSVAGTWRATKWELSEVASPDNRLDLVGAGATIRLVLTDAKTFTITMTWLGEQEVIVGTWALTGNVLTITAQGETSTFTLASNRTSLALVEEHSWFDFDDCGEDEEAHLNVTFVRE